MASRMPQDGEGINEINITPFVDIVLVLLIIFMISTPALVYRGLRVNLPKAVSAKELSHVTLKITVLKEGTFLLDNRAVKLEDIATALLKMKETKTGVDALVLADKDALHGKVMEVADFLRERGVDLVGFATK